MTTIERVRVLSYRAALCASALLLSLHAVGDVGFLDGTGIVDLSGRLEEQATTTLPLWSGAALLSCPLPSNRIAGVGAASLGLATLAGGLYSALSGSYESLPWSFAILALMVISIREIWYFGPAYKIECGITLFMLPLMLDLNNHVPFAIPLGALGMGVLAAGKIFEPCEEDLVRSNSEFLAR